MVNSRSAATSNKAGLLLQAERKSRRNVGTIRKEKENMHMITRGEAPRLLYTHTLWKWWALSCTNWFNVFPIQNPSLSIPLPFFFFKHIEGQGLVWISGSKSYTQILMTIQGCFEDCIKWAAQRGQDSALVKSHHIRVAAVPANTVCTEDAGRRRWFSREITGCASVRTWVRIPSTHGKDRCAWIERGRMLELTSGPQGLADQSA